MKGIHIILLVGLIALGQNAIAQVVINEVASSNAGTILDEDGETPDWIELYNPGTDAVDMTGWFLSDDSLETNKWAFPATTLPSGGFLLVFASDKNRTSGPYLHTNFRLGAGREPVLLSNAAGQRVDAFPIRCIPSNVSFGRGPDGTSTLFHFNQPTPGTSNDESSRFTIRQITDTLVFSQLGGFYDNPFSLTLTVTSPETRIHYTTDGSDPDETSPVYAEPIAITSRAGQENDISEEETSPAWRPPATSVYKATVIRAAAYVDGCPATPIVTHTYFVDPTISQRYSFPILSLATTRNNFFGNNRGIYVVGENPDGIANYNRSGDEWERPIHLEYFSNEGKLQFAQNLGARMHGRGSRGNPQKTIRLYAKPEYGADWMNYAFFETLPVDSLKRILLRSPDTDFSNTLFKDELVHTLLQGTGLDIQSYQPAIVFLNGEYWGIHNIRERQDKYYVGSRYGLNPDSIDIQGYDFGDEVIEGDGVHYQNMLAYIRANDLQLPEHYAYIQTQMDVDNYVDYQIAQLFFANTDWPQNNVRYWRPRTPTGRWRWFFFDCDACMIRHSSLELGKYADKAFEDNLERFLLRNLLRNDEFRERFLRRFYHHLNTTFEPGRVIRLIDQFRDAYAPMVAEHVARWNRPPNESAWFAALEEMKRFAIRRPVEMMRQLTEQYQIPFTLYPNPATDRVHIRVGDAENGAVRLTLTTLQGQPVREQSLPSGDAAIDVSGLSPGFYLARIQYGNLVFTQKLIIAP